MLLPSFDTGHELLFGFLLEAFLQLIDSVDNGLHALELALVLRSDDFLESPLDHEILPDSSLRDWSNIPVMREKQGGMEPRMRDFFHNAPV